LQSAKSAQSGKPTQPISLRQLVANADPPPSSSYSSSSSSSSSSLSLSASSSSSSSSASSVPSGVEIGSPFSTALADSATGSQVRSRLDVGFSIAYIKMPSFAQNQISHVAIESCLIISLISSNL
jgi:hypothetical protein